MRKLVYVILSIAACLLSGAVLTSAQNSTGLGVWGTTCPAPNGDFTKGGQYPRYEYRNHRLVLVDILSGKVTKELVTDLTAPQFWMMTGRQIVAI